MSKHQRRPITDAIVGRQLGLAAITQRASICGSVYSGPEDDCVCLEDEHDDETPHRCTAPGCGREWNDRPVRGTAMTDPNPIEKLDAIPGDDPERAHSAADDVLLSCVPADVAAAYRRVAARCGWWAAA